MPEASDWIDELLSLAARSGMRELTVRSHLHRAALGDRASADAARLLACDIENPALHVLVEHRSAVTTIRAGQDKATSSAAPTGR
jgi:hypothetical protein